MQLLIKQRVFSWTDTYDVYDEHENPKYFVKAEFFALGHQIHVYDKSGQDDTYVIDIVDPKDEVMALMLAIAIDAANCTK